MTNRLKRMMMTVMTMMTIMTMMMMTMMTIITMMMMTISGWLSWGDTWTVTSLISCFHFQISMTRSQSWLLAVFGPFRPALVMTIKTVLCLRWRIWWRWCEWECICLVSNLSDSLPHWWSKWTALWQKFYFPLILPSRSSSSSSSSSLS